MTDQNIKQLQDRVETLGELVANLLKAAGPTHTGPSDVDDIREALADLSARVKAMPTGVTRAELDATVRATFAKVPDAVVPPVKAKFAEQAAEIANAKADMTRVVESRLHSLDERTKKSEQAHIARAIVAADVVRRLARKELTHG